MDTVTIGTPQPHKFSPLGETLLGTCDGLTYTQLLDNGYGLTPITPSNSAESSTFRTPVRSKSVKRRLILEDGNVDGEGFRTPVKTPKRIRPRSVSSFYIPDSSPSAQQRTVSPGAKGSRSDTSLGKLTKEFVFLLQSANDGTVDLNKASDALNVQKRRIYDITNVLEGIGLVNKKSKNNVQWTSTKTASKDLENTLDDLEAKENELNDLIATAEGDLLQMSQDKRFAYITYQDLHSIKEYKENTVFAVKAPPGTQLQVPQDLIEQGYKIHLKSEGIPIEVFLSESSGVESPKKDGIRKLESPQKNENSFKVSALASPPSPMRATPSKQVGSRTSLFTTPKKEPASPQLDRVIKSELLSSPEDSFKGAIRNSSSGLWMDYDPLSAAILDTDDDLDVIGRRLKMKPENSIGGVDLCFGPSSTPPPFLSLEPPLSDSDYTFSLDNSEGLNDLFDFNFLSESKDNLH